MRTAIIAAILFAGLSQGIKLVEAPKKCDDDCQGKQEAGDPTLKEVACSLRDKQKADISSAPVLEHQKDIEKIAEDGFDKITAMKKKKCVKSYDNEETECDKKDKKEDKKEKKTKSSSKKSEDSPSSTSLDNGAAKLINDADTEKSLERAEKAAKK